MKFLFVSHRSYYLGYLVIVLFSLLLVNIGTAANRSGVQDSRYLLLDSRIIDKTENTVLTVGTVHKYEGNPLFGQDKPWEKRFDNLYGNVMYDNEEKLYKCWYSPFIVDQSALGMSLEERKNIEYDSPDNREMAICYTTSKDGITWEKSELGITEYNHSKANNILLRGHGDLGEHWAGPHGSGIFKDLREKDPARRYKALLKSDIISVAFSADGIHWGQPTACPTADVAGDTHNNALWAPTLNKYVGISRSWGEAKGRQVVRIESDDFIHWTKAKLVLEGIEKNYQTYAMAVFYYSGVYLGMVAIHDQKADRVWTELTWSPDTKNWHRVCPGTPLIPNSNTVLDYDYGCVYTCAYPIFLENEIRLYYGGSDYLHSGWRNGYFCLATLRPDGFAGYKAQSEGGKILTKNISYTGGKISVNADVNKGGHLKVKVLDKNGKLIAKSRTLSASLNNDVVQFDKKINKGSIKLQFEFANATLYSFDIGK